MQVKINVGGGCVLLDPHTQLQTAEPGGMEKTPRQPVKLATAGVCRSLQREVCNAVKNQWISTPLLLLDL